MADKATFQQHLPAMLDTAAQLVAVESPSTDVESLDRCADLLATLGIELLGRPPIRHVVDGRSHLVWQGNGSGPLVVGHYDTVWPLETTKAWGFSVEGDIARGPGLYDMKAGVVSALYAIAESDRPEATTLVLNADEEIGSPTSRMLIEEFASAHRAALVMESAVGRTVKVARKGIGLFDLVVNGRAAHAGVEPEKGINATVEIAAQVERVLQLANPEHGTTVTPTTLSSGSSINTIPSSAQLHLDVRSFSMDDLERVEQELRRLQPVLRDAQVELIGKINRPPMEREQSAELLGLHAEVVAELGLPPMEAIATGGASDANFTSGVGTPSIDGLGPDGGGAHADDEHIVVSSWPERTAIVSRLIDRISNGALVR